MSDVPVHVSPIDWMIVPPSVVKQGGLFTVVARFEGRIDPQVYEAYIPDEFGRVSERFLGNYMDTDEGFNNDEHPSTYVWFNIWPQQRGKVEIKFRLTWSCGGIHLFGALETFIIRIRKGIHMAEYRTDDQDLLALLDPRYYDPTPIEEMNARA